MTNQHGARTANDLRELWSRIVFNMLVSNADDHLRSYGFNPAARKGLAALRGVPVPDAHGLKLNVSEADNVMDLDLARAVAPYFRVSARLASERIQHCRSVVAQWRKIAEQLSIPAREQERMAPAFRLAA